MERIVNKTTSHAQARRWDIHQQVKMTPQERQRAARQLRARAYPADSKDVRAWHRSK